MKISLRTLVSFGSSPVKRSLKSGLLAGILFLWALGAAGQAGPPDPNWRWLRQIGSTGVEEVNDVRGSVAPLLAGSFTGTMSIGTTTHTSRGGKDGFFVRYLHDGVPEIRRSFGGTGEDIAKFIGAATSGSKMWVAGTYTQTTVFQDVTGSLIYKPSAGQEDIFLAQYDGGNFLKLLSIGGPGSEDIYGMAVNSVGGAVVIGTFTGTITVGSSSTVKNVTLSSAGGKDIFYASYDSYGDLVFAKRLGGPLDDIAGGIAYLPGGADMYITGTFSGTATFGTTPITAFGPSDIFVSRCTWNNGTVLWTNRIGGSATVSMESQGVAATPTGLYVSGNFRGLTSAGTNTLESAGGQDILLAAYNSAGTLTWARREGGKSDDHVTAVAANAAGDVWLSGYFANKTGFGPDTLLATAPEVGFIAKFDNTGLAQYARAIAGAGSSRLNALTISPADNVFTGGSFSNTARFWPYNYTSAGATDGFVVKLGVGEYCTMSSTGCKTSGKITNVSITGTTFNNTTGCAIAPSTSNVSTYAPTPTTTATITAGSSIQLNINTDCNGCNVYAWIDYNRNGLYETNEFTELRTNTLPNTIYRTTIPIPGNSLPGVTGLRVSSTWGGTYMTAAEACASKSYNEIENYTLTIATNQLGLGVSESLKTAINLYPNPANGIFELEIPETVKPLAFDVMDLTGKTLLNRKAEPGKTSLDLTGLPNGTYLVRLLTSAGSVTKKVMIMH